MEQKQETIEDILIVEVGRDSIKLKVTPDYFIPMEVPNGCAVVGRDLYVLSTFGNYYTLVKKDFKAVGSPTEKQ